MPNPEMIIYPFVLAAEIVEPKVSMAFLEIAAYLHESENKISSVGHSLNLHILDFKISIVLLAVQKHIIERLIILICYLLLAAY